MPRDPIPEYQSRVFRAESSPFAAIVSVNEPVSKIVVLGCDTHLQSFNMATIAASCLSRARLASFVRRPQLCLLPKGFLYLLDPPIDTHRKFDRATHDLRFGFLPGRYGPKATDTA